MKFFVVLCTVLAACSALAVPEFENHDLLLRSRRGLEIFGNIRRHIQVLIDDLNFAARDALLAVDTFRNGMKDEVEGVKDKIKGNMSAFRSRVTYAIDNVMQRVSNTSGAVRDCVNTHRSAASALFDETLSGAMACADDSVRDVAKQIQDFMLSANNAIAEGASVLDSLKDCAIDTSNMLSSAKCMGSVVLKAEVASARYMTQFAINMGRLNLQLAMLPVSLEMCAGKRLIQTGIDTGRLILRIGSCSTLGAYNAIVGMSVV